MHGWTCTNHATFGTSKNRPVKSSKPIFAIFHSMALFSHYKLMLFFSRWCKSTQKNAFFFPSLPLNSLNLKSPFCSMLPNVISGSQLMNRCLSKHGHYNYQEVQPPSHSVESTWNSVPSSSSFWNTTKQNYTSSFISQEFNSMLLQTPGRPCSTTQLLSQVSQWGLQRLIILTTRLSIQLLKVYIMHQVHRWRTVIVVGHSQQQMPVRLNMSMPNLYPQ